MARKQKDGSSKLVALRGISTDVGPIARVLVVKLSTKFNHNDLIYVARSKRVRLDNGNKGFKQELFAKRFISYDGTPIMDYVGDVTYDVEQRNREN